MKTLGEPTGNAARGALSPMQGPVGLRRAGLDGEATCRWRGGHMEGGGQALALQGPSNLPQ